MASGRTGLVIGGLSALCLAALTIVVPPRVEAGAATGEIKGQVVVRARASTDGPLSPLPDSSGTVVYVTDFTGPPPKRSAPPAIAQKDKAFVPSLLVVVSGETVSFPNLDPIYHNVFSDAPEHFDLGQYSQGDAATHVFKTVGIYSIYCNIHPQMEASLVVLPNGAYAVTDAAGDFAIENVPLGHHTVAAWHSGATAVTASCDLTAAGCALQLSVDQTLIHLPHKNKFGQSYSEW